jgi:hypothetical protein
MSNVAALFDSVPVPGEPDAEIIEKLEELLVRAKSGEIDGLAVAIVIPGDVQATWWRGRKWASVACAVGSLHHRIFSDAEE